MCGLSGLLTLSRQTGGEELRVTVTRMADTLRHRGPDDGGAWIDAPAGIAFGFRRLSILDLSPEGHQPMHSAGGRYVLAFNGEVYNFRALRAELEGGAGGGVRFRGHSDTEVLLAAIEQWGVEAAVRRCVGMFAFAVWDRREQALHLVRDRLGEKPLYYGWMGDTFLFGSELKAFQAHPDFRGKISRDALALYLRYGYVPAPYSIFEGVSKLIPGTVLTLERAQAGVIPTPVPYWSARGVAANGAGDPLWADEAAAADRLDCLLRSAVSQQMVADVPLGAFLFGGTDSSLIVALMQAQSPRPVQTFTIGFEEPGYDEAAYARAVACHLGTDHTELYVTPAEAVGVIPQLPTLYDEPLGDSSQIPTFLVSRLAKRSVTVSLSGDGADELFAGYERYVRAHRFWNGLQRFPRLLRRTAVRALAGNSAVWHQAVKALRRGLPQGLQHYACVDKLDKLAELLATADAPEATYQCWMSRWNGARGVVLGAAELQAVRQEGQGDFLQSAMYFDLATYLPDDLLTKVDRASMAVSLEVRAPFLDHRVMEYACRLPASMKVRDGRRKWLLRQVLFRYVPPGLVERPKMGFCLPIDAWLRGPLREWAEDLVDERRLRREGFFDPAAIRKKWHEHVSGQYDWQGHLWPVLMFQAWLGTQ